MRKHMSEGFTCERCGVVITDTKKAAYIEGHAVCRECKDKWNIYKAIFFHSERSAHTGMDDYDITFCSDEKCLRTDCKRHPSHTPKGVPYSMADLSSHEVYRCDNYWPDYEEEKNERKAD